jgi:Leucine-rich repeat (LRR) protein
MLRTFLIAAMTCGTSSCSTLVCFANEMSPNSIKVGDRLPDKIKKWRMNGAQIIYSSDVEQFRNGIELLYGKGYIVDLSSPKIDLDLVREVISQLPLLALNLEGMPVTDREIQLLQNSKLFSLNLSGTRISDRVFPTIASCENIKELYLGNLRQQPSYDLTPLRGLRNVEVLDLGESRIRSNCLASLSEWTSLKELYLQDTRVCNVDLGSFKSLTHLDLTKTCITDGFVKVIAKNKELRLVNLRYTKVTDTDLIQLARMDKLDTLMLEGTGITDQGISALENMKGLKRLFLSETRVSETAIEKLRKRHLGASIR